MISHPPPFSAVHRSHALTPAERLRRIADEAMAAAAAIDRKEPPELTRKRLTRLLVREVRALTPLRKTRARRKAAG